MRILYMQWLQYVELNLVLDMVQPKVIILFGLHNQKIIPKI